MHRDGLQHASSHDIECKTIVVYSLIKKLAGFFLNIGQTYDRERFLIWNIFF